MVEEERTGVLFLCVRGSDFRAAFDLIFSINDLVFESIETWCSCSAILGVRKSCCELTIF